MTTTAIEKRVLKDAVEPGRPVTREMIEDGTAVARTVSDYGCNASRPA